MPGQKTRRRPLRGEIERRDAIFVADGLPEIDDSVLLRLGLPPDALSDPVKRIHAYRLLKEYFSAVEKGHKAMQAKVKADHAPLMGGLEEELKLKRLDIMKVDLQSKQEKLNWERSWREKGFRTEKEALKDEAV